MACYHPLTAYRTRGGDITFRQGHGVGVSIPLPCGQCIGCRLERSRQWAVRCMHEASMHVDNCFITLTYDDDHLPDPPTLVKRDFQLFMKRLRKYFSPKPIRYFLCGEYGDQTWRPHYHAIIFGINFQTDTVSGEGESGFESYYSRDLERLWGLGFASFGRVDFGSAAYVARYNLKKRGGKMAKDWYSRTDPITGEIYDLLPEFGHMSLKPGIGKAWYDKFYKDVFPSDNVVFKGREMAVPKYYSKLFDKSDPFVFEAIKLSRVRRASRHKANNTSERLAVRKEVKESRIINLKRSI